MVSFTFKPAPKAFGETPVQRSIDVEVGFFNGAPDKDDSIEVIVNGKRLSIHTVAHAVAFAIKQRLANSYVNAATAKNDAGGLLPISERLALWQGGFDKVLGKIIDPDASPAWESVFVEGTRESVDPIGAEVSKIVRAKLVAWAKKKEKTLPKADSPEYAALKAKLMVAQGESIRAEATAIVAARNAAIGDSDDFDLDESDLPGAETETDSTEPDLVPEV